MDALQMNDDCNQYSCIGSTCVYNYLTYINHMYIMNMIMNTTMRLSWRLYR